MHCLYIEHVPTMQIWSLKIFFQNVNTFIMLNENEYALKVNWMYLLSYLHRVFTVENLNGMLSQC